MIQTLKGSGHYQLLADELRKKLSLQGSTADICCTWATGSNNTPDETGCYSDPRRPMTLLHHYLESKGISQGETAFEFLTFCTAIRQSPYLSANGDSVVSRNLKQHRWNFLHLGSPKSLQEIFYVLKWFLWIQQCHLTWNFATPRVELSWSKLVHAFMQEVKNKHILLELQGEFQVGKI